MRQWWGDMEPRVASLVEHITSVHCAPLLCAEEMKVIQGKDMHHGNMLVMKTTAVSDIVFVHFFQLNVIWYQIVKTTTMYVFNESHGLVYVWCYLGLSTLYQVRYWQNSSVTK